MDTLERCAAGNYLNERAVLYAKILWGDNLAIYRVRDPARSASLPRGPDIRTSLGVNLGLLFRSSTLSFSSSN